MATETGYCTADARQQFDSWSHSYDRNPLQWFFFEPSHRLLLETLAPQDRRVLDVGCGTGLFAERIRQRFPGTQVCGLDLSAGMLGQASCRAAGEGSRFHRVQGDSARLPFASDTFDAITCSHSLHHYPNPKRVVAEMHRVLRPGGRLLIVDGDPDRLWGHFLYDWLVVWLEGPVRHLSSADFRALFRRTGFKHIAQQRRGGILPFLMTVGQAVKRRGARKLVANGQQSLVIGP
jgi:ubiquinone/menaquinone biosynthesis C-methylase UbiE